jgi:hypothetical protein
MPLISYVMTATNKRLLISESRSANQCTPCRGKPDTFDMYAFRASPRMPHIHFLRAVHVHGNLSLAINSVGRTIPLPRKRVFDTIPSMPADRSVGPPTSLSPKTTTEVVMKSKHLLTTSYIGLRGP